MLCRLIQRLKLNVCMLFNSLYAYTKNEEIGKVLRVALLSFAVCTVEVYAIWHVQVLQRDVSMHCMHYLKQMKQMHQRTQLQGA